MAKRHMKGKHRLTRHHKLPSSRNGDNSKENIVELPHWVHKGIHDLFGNMTYDEIMSFLMIIYHSNERFDSREIYDIIDWLKKRTEEGHIHGRR